MVLAPGTGVTATTDGLGGSLNVGLATGGDAVEPLPPRPRTARVPDPTTSISHFISWEGRSSGPPGLASLD